MASDLLQTKLYAPRLRSSLVPRPRLIEKLNNGQDGKLTLISAPAGFGKTTMVTEWLSQLPTGDSELAVEKYAVAWVSLDEGNNDPTRFLGLPLHRYTDSL